MDAAYPLAGLVVGFLVGLTGVGGGALMTPLLILVFGITPSVAVGTDLLYAGITKSGGVAVHRHQGTVDWPIALWLMCGSLPAAGLTLVCLRTGLITTSHLDTLISGLLGAALMLTALVLLLKKYLRSLVGRRQNLEHQSVPLTVAVGAFLGMVVTLTSVGAGALGAAALFLLYPRLSSARVVGTDLAHAVPLTLVAGLGHLQLGNVDTGLLFGLLMGSLPGIYLGSRLSAGLPEAVLRPILASLLAVIGTVMVW